ncbi:hypothetical protein BGZ54_006245 [Gamsiella multidivaricata]|nr:hypothetical protein BGZ54_006245 [Gamsiella multidivaricata]
MRLKNDISDITIHEHYWGDLASFLRRVPSLRELVIRSMNSHVIPVAVWQTIATSLPTLRTLVFNGAHMDGEDPLRFDYFLDACSKVESLDLDFFSFWDPPAHNPRWTSTDPLFPRLVSLNFFGRRAEELRLFERCLQTPGLRRLTWSTRFPTQFTPAEKTPEVTRLIVEARLQNLEYLNLWDGLPFKDEEIARILDSLGRPLKELRVSASEFGYLSWNALLRGHSQMEVDPTATESDSSRPDVVRLAHAATLRTLDLTLCPDVTDDMLAQIKRDFPRLEQLLLREEPDYDSSEELEE